MSAPPDLLPDAPFVLNHDSISALFLGPKAGNFDLVLELFSKVLNKQKKVRENYHREDKDFITPTIKASEGYKTMTQRLDTFLDMMTDLLNRHSVPFFSPRYSAHMSTDMSLPGIVGYMSTMLFNPNNVAFEASPITTLLELEAGKDMCRMLGYRVDRVFNPPISGLEDVPIGWGHVSCDGTVANLEAIWSARNLKFYPLALVDAIQNVRPGGPNLAALAGSFRVPITGGKGETELLVKMTPWQLLNLTPSVVNDLPERLYNEYGISAQYLEKVMKQYSIQSVSKDDLKRRWDIEYEPQILITSTRHYSWPKSAAIAGIGSENCYDIDVDNEARLDIDSLRKALEDRVNKRAVYMVVAVIGSTEEGAVDPLQKIIALRDEMEKEGMSFIVHADAAWGGYFASMIRHHKDPGTGKSRTDIVPNVPLRRTAASDLRHLGLTDSITIDPHKAGYIPYPAGGLCYRDGRQRFLLTWTAPYLNQSSEGESIGVYGVEGSKPGASPAAVYLAHRVIGPHANGYGVLLGEAAFNCRRFAAHWSAMSTEKSSYIVVPFNPIPAEKEGKSSTEIEEQKKFIRERILPKENDELVKDEEAMAILNELGSDLNINIFACNFRDDEGNPNTDIELANHLNWRIFQRLSVTDKDQDPSAIPFYLTGTKLAQSEYKGCATNLKKRLGLVGDQDIFVLRNVVMSPFGSTFNFVAELAKIFKEVLISEIAAVKQRAMPQRTTHTFLMQGLNELYFVHLPSLYRNGEGYQTIFTAEIGATALEKYRKAQQESPDATFVLQNKFNVPLQQLLNGSPFKASISIWKDGDVIDDNVEVDNVRVVKQRPLRTTTYHSEYPDKMPFYLYGTPADFHLDHIYLLAPNIQLTAGDVDVADPSLVKQLDSKELESGFIAIAKDVQEGWMQPFPEKLPGGEFFFRRGKELKLDIYKDPYDAKYDGKIDLKALGDPLATDVNIILNAEIYVDSKELNADSTYGPIPFKKLQSDKPKPAPVLKVPAGIFAGEPQAEEEMVAFTEEAKAERWWNEFNIFNEAMV